MSRISFRMLSMSRLLMVQGIIDCYFKDKDGFVLIDYKSDFVNLAGVHYFDANTPVSIFRNRLKALSPSVDSFLSLVTEMPKILKEVTPNQADRMIRDFIDFYEEYFKNMSSTEWKRGLKAWGVYPYQQGVLFNPMIVYGHFKKYLSPEQRDRKSVV